MKKILSRLMGVALVAVALVSCSKDGSERTSDLLSRIPADADIVVAGDLAAIAKSADVELTADGVSSIPGYIADQIPFLTDDNLKEVNGKIKELGVDVTSAAIFVKESLGEPVIVARVKDSSALASFMKSNGFEESESDGMKVYTLTDEEYWGTSVSCAVVSDDYVYSYVDEVYVYNGKDPQRDLIKTVKSVSSANFASTPAGEYIAKGNAGGFALVCSEKTAKMLKREGVLPAEMMRDAEGAFLGVRFDLNDSELKLTCQVLDKNGSTFDMSKYTGFATPTATINPKAVEYLAPETCALFAVTLAGIDWNAVIDRVAGMTRMSSEEETIMRMAANYMKSLEGTVTVGVGVKNGLYSIADMANGNLRNIFDNLVVSAAVQTQPGKAKPIFNEMAALVAASGIPYFETENGIGINVNERDLCATFYISAFDDMLTMSTVPVTGRTKNAVGKAINVDDYNSVMAMVLDKNSDIMKQLGANIGLQLMIAGDPKNVESIASLKALGTSDPLLKALIKAGIDVFGNYYRLLPIFESADSVGNYFDDSDYAAAEEILYDEEAWDWED